MIRKAAEQDIYEMMDIYNDAILHTTATFDTETKDYENRKQWFAAHTGAHVIYVYETDGHIAGYASLSQYRDRKAFDTVVEISIYIHPDYRGKHIGSELMEEILKFAQKEQNIDTVVSLITSENETSIHLHEKYGFTYCGQIHNAGMKFGKRLHLNAYEICYERNLE